MSVYLDNIGLAHLLIVNLIFIDVLPWAEAKTSADVFALFQNTCVSISHGLVLRAQATHFSKAFQYFVKRSKAHNNTTMILIFACSFQVSVRETNKNTVLIRFMQLGLEDDCGAWKEDYTAILILQPFSGCGWERGGFIDLSEAVELPYFALQPSQSKAMSNFEDLLPLHWRLTIWRRVSGY